MQRRTGPGWAVNCVEECLSHCKLACVARGLRSRDEGKGTGGFAKSPPPAPLRRFFALSKSLLGAKIPDRRFTGIYEDRQLTQTSCKQDSADMSLNQEHYSF